MFPHVALKPRLPLLLEAAPLSWTSVEALLGVISIPVLVNEDCLADLALDWDQVHPLNVPLQKPSILESPFFAMWTNDQQRLHAVFQTSTIIIQIVIFTIFFLTFINIIIYLGDSTRNTN